MRNVDVIQSCDRETFEKEIATRAEPVVFRQLVAHWPMVSYASESDLRLAEYLRKKTTPGGVRTIEAPASANGRFFYAEDYQGFNFERKVTSFDNFIGRLLNAAGRKNVPTLSIQSAFMDEYFHEINADHSMPLMSPDIRPRIWIGNRTVVPTHYDDAENIACVAAGKRRFTLFPPDQIFNLYIGPLDNTPAGAPVSMASLTPPDIDRFPRLSTALEHAYVAELEPGDAIYIPTLWWHHVEALSDINVLVNFWQGGAIGGKAGPMPLDSLLLALLTIKSRPQKVRNAWKAFFDHYVFETNGDPASHLPDGLKGVLGGIDDNRDSRLREWLIKQLSA